MRALIDTCVIIDVLQSRQDFDEDARNVFRLSASKAFDGYISAKALTDIYYLTHRITHSEIKTRDIISRLLSIFDVLDTKGTDCKKALLSNMNDYEDAVMVETALSNEINCIVTRNIKDYTDSRIKVLEPKEFTELLQNN